MILAFVASAVLLTVIQPPFGMAFLAWVAFVPFVIGSLANEKIWPTILTAYIIGLLYWLGNLYWLVPVTIAGWIVLCLYMALYWPAIALSLRYCVQRKVPLWFSLAILVVGAEAAWGWLFSWRFLGHSQFRNIPLIQIADLFGVAGISFIIAMVNGFIAEIIIDLKKRQVCKQANLVGIILTIFVITAALFYGRYRINEASRFIQAGPRIGVVQSNVPVKSGEDTEPAEVSFLNMLSDSRKCLLDAEPNLIIWPETMVEAILDDSYLKLIAEDCTTKIFHNALVRHSNEGANLLIGSFAGNAVMTGGRIEFKTNYNSAFLYEPNQAGPRQHYDKISLVPFGEYLPFKKTLPFMHKILMMLTPYDYDYTLDAGSEYTIFKMPVKNNIYRFGVMICFEDIVPKIARRFAVDKDGNKQADWLVTISNDGWFVKKTGNNIKASTELGQRMAICVFRAIENRLSVIRCANTGISCLIDSSGNIKNDFPAGTLNKKAVQRTGQSGWFADKIFIDKRITIFSKNGQLLDIVCAICLILTIAVSIYKLR